MLLSRIIRSIKRRYAEYKGGEVYINAEFNLQMQQNSD